MRTRSILTPKDADYSRIRHLAMAMFLGRWRSSLMAMFTVYFDASGSGTQGDALSVAGFIARTDEWVRFEKSWQIVLNAYKVKALHMKEFAPGSGEFASWKDNKKRRREFMQDLIDVIGARCLNSFVCCIMLAPFRELDNKYCLSETHKPFALAGTNCIDKVVRWAKRNKAAEEKIAYMFEDGDKDKGDLMRFSEKLFNYVPNFLKKNQSVAFQAADLLAYEHRRANSKIFAVGTGVLGMEDLRGTLQALDKTPPHQDDDWGIYALEELKALCSKNNYPLRAALKKPVEAELTSGLR